MGTWSDDERQRKRERESVYNLGRAQGRADERAAVVAWLRSRTAEYTDADTYADRIESDEHVDAAKEEP